MWVKLLNNGLTTTILAREAGGFVAVIGYLFVMPLLLAKTKLKSLFEREIGSEMSAEDKRKMLEKMIQC